MMQNEKSDIIRREEAVALSDDDTQRRDCAPEQVMLESTIPRLRDPYVLCTGGRYYVYGTGYRCYYADALDAANWVGPFNVVDFPAGHENDGDHWAPEVHEYRGAYYMLTTYHSSKTAHRGCTILRADNPLGPFREITGGQITPLDWDAIDGTFYLDEAGQPWMIFVHEWTSTDDGVGRMAAAKLSGDLTYFIGEPVELFRATDPAWATNKVTDGCFMYRTASGTLLMLWSNWDRYGYCVGIARSESGKVTGHWAQEREPLYSKSITGRYDGGHGMIFCDAAGKMWLSLHSPNHADGERKEKPVFIPVREDRLRDTLVWRFD